MDSLAIGKFVQPMMEKLVQRVMHLDAALLCTADGFNVCSVGVSQEQIGKLSALASTLLSIGEATIANLIPTPDAPQTISAAGHHLDTMVLEAGPICLVGVKLRTSSPLNLIAAAQKTAMGVLLVSVRATAKDIEQRMQNHA